MTTTTAIAAAITVALLAVTAFAGDTNRAFSPCMDTRVQRHDGFTLGIAFASKDKFFYNNGNVQLSPCDARLSLSNSNSQISVFRPKVDEISLLTVNSSSFVASLFSSNWKTGKENFVTFVGVNTVNVGSLKPESGVQLFYIPLHSTYAVRQDAYGYMVAFAGRKYAARSPPAFVANSTYTVTSFTLVLEFKKGRLQNLYWKRDGCVKCAGNSKAVCLNNQDCALQTSSCKSHGGSVDCSLGIQLAFSGTDEHLSVLNSWYEVKNLRQYSLYGLYSNLRDSLSSQYDKFF